MRISDWSSDVCSSDLTESRSITMSKMNFRRLGFAAMTGAALALAGCATPFRADVARFQTQLPAPQGQSFVVETNDPRSEERRVGKECVSTCRSRWSP